MTKQSNSHVDEDDVCPKRRVGDMGDCTGKSEHINDLSCGVHLVETRNRKLEAAELGGFAKLSAERMLAEFKGKVDKCRSYCTAISRMIIF